MPFLIAKSENLQIQIVQVHLLSMQTIFDELIGAVNGLPN